MIQRVLLFGYCEMVLNADYLALGTQLDFEDEPPDDDDSGEAEEGEDKNDHFKDALEKLTLDETLKAVSESLAYGHNVSQRCDSFFFQSKKGPNTSSSLTGR